MTPLPPKPTPPESATRIARDLTGDLLCLRCRYNLRGLSITQQCPECGLPVKATLLAVVDPLADELTPLSTPRITGAGLILWPLGALIATVVVWGVRMHELTPFNNFPEPTRWWIQVGVIGLLLSLCGAASMIRPHASTSNRTLIRNCLGTLAYLPAAWCFWVIHTSLDTQNPMPFAKIDAAHELRAPTRLCVMISAAFIIAALRPTVRALYARSRVVREGRVDRQPMIALIGAFLLTACGDLIHIASNAFPLLANDLTRTLEVLLVALGSVLLTLGLFGLVRDGVRVYPVICSNPLGLADILGKRRAKQND